MADKFDVQRDYLVKFGRHLRKLRNERNMTMKELAIRCDVEYSQIARVEHANINTSLSMIRRLAIALNLQPKELLDFEN